MRGKDKLNFAAFDAATVDLRGRGFRVFSPADADRAAGFTGSNGVRGWQECIMQDAKEVLEADLVLLLPGWEQSRGVFAELAILAGGRDAGDYLPVFEYFGPGQEWKHVEKPFERIALAREKKSYRTTGIGEIHDSQVKAGLVPPAKKDGPRVFESGATRNADTGKPDFEGFLSPYVLDAFGEYMHKHRHLEDGSLRDSDNWQKGIPLTAYIKSGWRHFVHWWMLHRGYPARDEKGQLVTMKDTLAALMFNVMGYFHEWLKLNTPKPIESPNSKPHYDGPPRPGRDTEQALLRGPGKPS